MRNHKLIIVGAIVALATIAASCGDSGSSSTPAATTTTAAAPAATSPDDGNTVYVTANDTKGVNADMSYDVSTTTVKAGEVTFVLDNFGTVPHEVVVIKTDVPFDQLVIGSNDRISEDLSIGEISETPAGQSASAQFALEPGNYVLVCNIEGHYRLGMRAALTVTA